MALTKWKATEIHVNDDLGPYGRIQMRTEATLTSTGRLLVTSSGTNLHHALGFPALIVLLYGAGQQPEWIWNTQPIRFGMETTHGSWDQASVTFARTVPLDVLACARFAAVQQFLSCSDDVWADVKPWLAAAQAPTTGFDTVRAYARPLACKPGTPTATASSATQFDSN